MMSTTSHLYVATGFEALVRLYAPIGSALRAVGACPGAAVSVVARQSVHRRTRATEFPSYLPPGHADPQSVPARRDTCHCSQVQAPRDGSRSARRACLPLRPHDVIRMVTGE